MKSFKIFLLPAISILFIEPTLVKDSYILSKDYTVTLQGTSNLHDWNEKVGNVSGDAFINWNNDSNFDLNAANIIMEVHSIKSDEGSIMNNNTYKALKADLNPEISFKLTSPVKSVPAKSNETLSAKGTLTIAGVTRSIEMQVKLFMQDNRKLAFEGTQTIKMSDYGIDPPTALFGTLKTGNEIKINFKVNFAITTNQMKNS